MKGDIWDSLYERFIAPLTDDAVTTRKKVEEKMQKEYEDSLQRHKVWNQPDREDKWWQREWNTSTFKRNFRRGGPTGKDCKYMATPDSRANSYSSILKIYKKLEESDNK